MNGTGRVRGCRPVAAAVCCLAATAGCASVSHPGAQRGHGTSAGASIGSAAQRRALAARYLVIARIGNHHLEVDFNRFNGRDRHRLAAAEADLRDAAATERLFDRRLLAMPLPPGIEVIARLLVAVNQQRAALTTIAARSRSLTQLDAIRARLEAANGPVEEGSLVIRDQLGLPPPETN